MTGKSGGERSSESIQFEGFGPNGVAVLVDCVTASPGRTAGELRKIFTDFGGELGGNVGWKFAAHGVIRVGRADLAEETLQAIARDAGAGEILSADPGAYVILTPPAALDAVRGVLGEHEIQVLSSEIACIPAERVGLEENAAGKVMGFLDALRAHGEVRKVWSDADIPREVLVERGGQGT